MMEFPNNVDKLTQKHACQRTRRTSYLQIASYRIYKFHQTNAARLCCQEDFRCFVEEDVFCRHSGVKLSFFDVSLVASSSVCQDVSDCAYV